MKVVIVGATGNVGTSLLDKLIHDDRVTSIVGIARRRPTLELAKTTWVSADVSTDALEPHLTGAGAVVHLAWVIQPSHDPATLYKINVTGSRRVFEAAGRAGVGALVYASSVGAYSPGPKDRRVDESWPTRGVQSSFYSRHKAEVETALDEFEQSYPDVRTVRLRPALIFKREAGVEVRRLFFGPLVPRGLVQPRFVPIVPDTPRLVFQAVHSYDVGDAYRLAITKEVTGAFNIGAEPVLDGPELGRLFGARTVGMSERLIRAMAAASWRAHLQPTPPGWVDLAFAAPLMDFTRAHRELGWTPSRTSSEALLDLLDGVHDSAGLDTPPLAPSTSGPARLRELATGIGRR